MFYWGWMPFDYFGKLLVYKADGYNGGRTPLELAILRRGAPEKLLGLLENRTQEGD